MITDVLATVSRGERNVGGADVTVDRKYYSLRISELRKLAHEKGLNVDGSREMLIAALKTVEDLESEDELDWPTDHDTYSAYFNKTSKKFNSLEKIKPE